MAYVVKKGKERVVLLVSLLVPGVFRLSLVMCRLVSLRLCTVDHLGFLPCATVVVVACTPSVVWSFWWALPMLPVDRLFMVGFARVISGPVVHGGLCPCYR